MLKRPRRINRVRHCRVFFLSEQGPTTPKNTLKEKRKEILDRLLHTFISGSPVKDYEAALSANGIMEGKERQGKAAKVFSSSAEDKGYAKFKGRL